MLKHGAVMGLLSTAIPFGLQSWAQHAKAMTSSLASLFNASTPLFAALVAALLLREDLKMGQRIGLLFGFVGVAIASGVGTGDFTAKSLIPQAAMIASVISYAFGFSYARRHLGGIDPVGAATRQLLMGSIFLAPLAAVTTAREGMSLTPTRIAAMLALGMAGTGLAWVLNLDNIAKLGATKASSVTFIVPIIAVNAGVFLLDEDFKRNMAIGGIITLFGVAMVQERVRFAASRYR